MGSTTIKWINIKQSIINLWNCIKNKICSNNNLSLINNINNDKLNIVPKTSSTIDDKINKPVLEKDNNNLENINNNSPIIQKVDLEPDLESNIKNTRKNSNIQA